MAIYGTLGDIEVNADYPSIQPTLDLNFAKTKALDPRITFYRSSLATYTDDKGIIRTVPENVPRFDHDLTTGESLGLLIEESRTNLLLRSVFSFSSINSYPTGWTGFNPGRVVRSIGQSPDGTDAAIVGKQFNNSGGFRPTSAVTIPASTNYTVSFYARRPTDSELSLFLSYHATNDATSQAYTKGVKIRYDDADGSTGFSSSSPSFTLTDSWQRFTNTVNSGSDTVIAPNFTSLTAGDAYDPAGLFVIACVQIEVGSFPTSYIPTTTSTVTRSADISYMEGTNFNSWYNQSEGSFVLKYKRDYTGSGSNFPGLITTNSLLVFGEGTNELIKNQTANVQLSAGSISTNPQNLYVTYSSAGYGGGLNGGGISTGSQTFGTNNTYFSFGVIQGTTVHRFSRILYYPKRLTNTQLQNLTA